VAKTGTNGNGDGRDNGPDPIVIKKYANRRLYNTASGEFVTLETLHRMVNDEEIFVVIDAKSGKDLTASILAQIIAEEENKGHSMLPLNMLRQLLKFYGDGVGPQFSQYMEHSIESFSKNQQEIMKQMTDMMSGTTGLNGWAEVSRRNLELFQESFGMMSGGSKASEEEEGETKPATDGADLDKLSQQLAEMQKQLDALSKKD